MLRFTTAVVANAARRAFATSAMLLAAAPLGGENHRGSTTPAPGVRVENALLQKGVADSNQDRNAAIFALQADLGAVRLEHEELKTRFEWQTRNLKYVDDLFLVAQALQRLDKKSSVFTLPGTQCCEFGTSPGVLETETDWHWTTFS